MTEPTGVRADEVSSGRVAIAVDMGGTSCRALLVDRQGTVLAEDHRPTGLAADACEVLLAAVSTLQQAATTRGQSVAGIALGVPGYVDPVTGVVSGAVNLGWEHAHPGPLLRERIGLPFRVDNDVNFAALGEAARGVGSRMRDFAVLALGTGVGGALVLDGRLRRGPHHAAGELGFLLPSREQLLHGPRMGMEAVLGGPAIAARARALARRSAPAPSEVWHWDAGAVFAAHRRGDPLAGRVVEEVVDHVAMVVIDVCAVLDLEGVVLDGSIGRALAPEMPRISERVSAALPHPVRLSVSVLEPSAAVVGASVAALEILDEVHP